MSYWQNFLTSHLSHSRGDAMPSGVRKREGINGEPVYEVGSITPQSSDRQLNQRCGPDFSGLFEK